MSPDRAEGRHQPERADQEGALLARQSVVGLVGAVAHHEPVLGQLLGDRGDRVAHPLVGARQEAEQRGQQGRGVEGVGVVVLAEDAAVADAVGEDVLLDLVGDRGPFLLELVVVADLGELGGPVECDPAHQLGRDVVLRLSPRFPDALVGLAPGRDRARGLRLHERPQPAGQVLAAPGVQEQRVEDGAEHVVLPLVEGAVPEADGLGALIARQVVAGGLGEVAAAVDAVHDLQAAVGVGLEVGDELHELVGLPVQVQIVQRLQGERRVAYPGVAVVPVALASWRLGQRRGQRSHGGSGRHVGEALDGQGRPLERVPQGVVGDPRPGQPAPPELHRGLDVGERLVGVGRTSQVLGPRQGAEGTFALRQHVPGAGRTTLDADRHVGAEPERRAAGVSGVGEATVGVGQGPGRLDPAVVERRLADEARPRPSLEALDRADEQVPGVVVRGRTGVGGHGVRALPRPHRRARRGPGASRPVCARWSPARWCPARRCVGSGR